MFILSLWLSVSTPYLHMTLVSVVADIKYTDFSKFTPSHTGPNGTQTITARCN